MILEKRQFGIRMDANFSHTGSATIWLELSISWNWCENLKCIGCCHCVLMFYSIIMSLVGYFILQIAIFIMQIN